jgi:hypothetical protein
VNLTAGIYPLKAYAALCAVCLFGVGGIYAPLVFVLVLKFAFALVVAGLISGWERHGRVFQETLGEGAVLYPTGVPVAELRSTLVNIHFQDRSELVRRLTGLAFANALLSALVFLFSVCELYVAIVGFSLDAGAIIALLLGGVSALALFSTCRYSLDLYLAVRSGAWAVSERKIEDVPMFSASFPGSRRGAASLPFLSALFGSLSLYWRGGFRGRAFAAGG